MLRLQAKKKAKIDHLDEKSEKDIIDAFNRLRKIEEISSEKTKAARKSYQRRNSGFNKAKNHIQSANENDELNNDQQLTEDFQEIKTTQILPFDELDDFINEQ